MSGALLKPGTGGLLFALPNSYTLQPAMSTHVILPQKWALQWGLLSLSLFSVVPAGLLVRAQGPRPLTENEVLSETYLANLAGVCSSVPHS